MVATPGRRRADDQGEFEFCVGGPRLDLAATIPAAAAWVTLTFGLVTRGLSAGQRPLINRYGFGRCFAWAIIGVHLPQRAVRRGAEGGGRTASGEGPCVMAPALPVAACALARPSKEGAIYPLLPALRSLRPFSSQITLSSLPASWRRASVWPV